MLHLRNSYIIVQWFILHLYRFHGLPLKKKKKYKLAYPFTLEKPVSRFRRV